MKMMLPEHLMDISHVKLEPPFTMYSQIFCLNLTLKQWPGINTSILQHRNIKKIRKLNFEKSGEA